MYLYFNIGVHLLLIDHNHIIFLYLLIINYYPKHFSESTFFIITSSIKKNKIIIKLNKFPNLKNISFNKNKYFIFIYIILNCYIYIKIINNLFRYFGIFFI